MWWGGFSERKEIITSAEAFFGLNPHVVGRFFRVEARKATKQDRMVLIPMWWGGFSELKTRKEEA